MNTLAKTVLTSAFLTVVIAGTSANAEGRAGNVYDNAQATQSVEIKKVSFEQATIDIKDFTSNR